MLWDLFELAPSPTLEDSLEEGGLLVDSCWFTFRGRQRALCCAVFYGRVSLLEVIHCYLHNVEDDILKAPFFQQHHSVRGRRDTPIKQKSPRPAASKCAKGEGLL
jgi:hypothetical protein